jgi:hypothetical protein
MNTEQEMRYWPRVGMKVTKETAEQFISRIVDSVAGSKLDEDLEEFTTISTMTAAELAVEIENLFVGEYVESPFEMDNTNLAILELMTYESRRKQIILEHKSSGMTLEESKEAYEEGKRLLVRENLDTPDSDEEE